MRGTSWLAENTLIFQEGLFHGVSYPSLYFTFHKNTLTKLVNFSNVTYTHVTLAFLLFSSLYWASVANAPNVLQPYWIIVLPLDVPDLIASLLLWGPSGQRWRCLWTFLFSNVPTFATSRLQEIVAAKGGITWARNGRWILPENARLPRNIQRSFTSRKSTTWDRRLYFPSEGRHAEDFFALKSPTASVGFWPAN